MKVLFVAFLIVVLKGYCCWAEGEFAGFEVYSDAPILFYAVRNCSEYGRVCVWATSDREIGLTVGPTLGPVSFGVGMSVNGLEVSYYNLDCRFAVKFYGISWEAVNLYQKGRGEVKDFLYSRQLISLGDFPVGIIGENRKEAGGNAQLFWGPCVQLGKMKIFASNRLCLTVNLTNRRNLWTAWLVDF